MNHDIQKAVEELKNAGMEDFLHQDPCQFDYDENCASRERDKCPKTRCTHVKKCTFVTRCTHVKKYTFITRYTRVRVKKWTLVTKRIREKRCIFVTKRIRVKKCKFVTKCIRYDKKCYWTKKCICEKITTYPHCNHRTTRCPDEPDSPCYDE